MRRNHGTKTKSPSGRTAPLSRRHQVRRQVKPRVKDTYSNELHGRGDDDLDEPRWVREMASECRPVGRAETVAPSGAPSTRQSYSPDQDRRPQHSQGDRAQPDATQSVPAPMPYEERRKLSDPIHANRLGALRGIRSVIEYGRACGYAMAAARAQIGAETFEAWTRPTLGIGADEALGWIKFSEDEEVQKIDVSPVVEVKPENLLRLIRLFAESFPRLKVYVPHWVENWNVLKATAQQG